MYQQKYLKYNKKISMHGGANSSDPWTCSRCNTINESNKSICEVCTNSKNPSLNISPDSSRPPPLLGIGRSPSKRALSSGLLIAKEEGYSQSPKAYSSPTANPDEEEEQRIWEEKNKEFLARIKKEAELYKQQPPSSAKKYQEAKQIGTPKEELSPPPKESTNSMCVIS
jgi:hypothetical protein